jgi:hypothetical protein
MSDQQLREAFALMQDGNKSEAIAIVRGVLQDDMNNINAWLLMANLLDDDRKKRKALERILAINPEHSAALKIMYLLDGEQPKDPVRIVEKPEKVKKNYWSKLQAREQEGFPSTKKTCANRVMLLFLFIVFGSLSLCGMYVFYLDTLQPIMRLKDVNGNTPNQVVMMYLEAYWFNDFATMRNLTCPKLVNQVDAEQDSLENYGVITEDLVVDMSDVTTERVRLKLYEATVVLHGDVIITIDGEIFTYNYDQDAREQHVDWIWEHVRRIGGVWMICDGPDTIRQ